MLTLDAEFQFLGVSDDFPAFPDHSPVLLGFSPEIGATIHAGNVENGNALKEDVAQVYPNPVTLRGRKKRSLVSVLGVRRPKVLCVCVWGALRKGARGPQRAALPLSDVQSWAKWRGPNALAPVVGWGDVILVSSEDSCTRLQRSSMDLEGL